MKRFITILGTLLIAMGILISGSAIAAWFYGTYIYSSNLSTNTNSILYAPDNNHATLGQNPSSLGYIVVDMGAFNSIPPSTQFTVFASFGGQTEGYNVSMSEDMITETYVGSADDSGNQVFTTPSTGTMWRYINLTGVSGSTSIPDPIYGPELDAVGWSYP